MDPNQRLQVLQQTNPSLRLSVAPAAPTPQLQVAQPSTPRPNLFVGNAQMQQDPNAHTDDADFVPPSSIAQTADFLNRNIVAPFRPFGEGLARLLPGGQNDIAANASQIASNDNNFQTYHDLYKSGKINADQFTKLATSLGSNYAQSAQDAQRIADSADRSKVLGSAAVAATAPFLGVSEGIASLLPRFAARAAEGAGLFTANEFANNANPTGKEIATQAGVGAGVGTVAAPVLGAFGKIIGKGISAIRGGAEGATNRLISKITNSSNPDTINQLLTNINPSLDSTTVDAVSHYLSTINDPETVRAALSAVQHPTPSTITTGFNPSNPQQSSVPLGEHPPGSPDPVLELASKAKEINNPKAFQKYVDGLSGEAKAAADSALNGRSVGEFYGLANPTTNIPLPPEDVAAIKAAGGTVPDTIPEVTPPNVEVPKPDLTEVPQKPLPVAEPTSPIPANASTPVTEPSSPVAQDVQQALADSSVKPTPSGVQTIAGDGSTTLPPEDIAAIKAAGGTVPQSATTDVAVAKQQVLDSLRSASGAYNKNADVQAGEKAARSAQAENAYNDAGGGKAGFHAKLGALKGEYSKSGFGIDMPPETQDALLNDIQNNDSLRPFEKINAQNALMKLSNDNKKSPTPYDIKMLRRVFGDSFGDTVQGAADTGSLGKPSKAEIVRQLSNIPKSIMASIDLSSPGRQGSGLLWRHPVIAKNAFMQQLKYWHSEDNYVKGMGEIEARPTYQRMIDAGLGVTGTEPINAQEEQYGSNLAEKIPAAGKWIKKSDRAFTGYLTQLRADTFDLQDSLLNKAGIQSTPESDKQMAKVINTFSGRGDLGKYLEPHATSLNTGFFSPKLWKSRLDMLNPLYYAKLDGPARQMAIENAATFTAGTVSVLYMAHLLGAETGMNPLSADFGKIKIGNTRYDITGGLSQNIVFLARELAGKSTNSQTGVTTPLGTKFGGDTRLSVIGNMVQNKENPLLSAASQLLRGKDRGGNPVNPLTTVGGLVVPLSIQGAYQTTQDIGSITSPKDLLKGTLMSAPDIVGISAQTYGSIPSKNKGKPDATGQPTYTGKIAPNMVTDYNGQVVLDAKGKPVTVTFPNGASDTTKQAMIDAKRVTAVKDAYLRTLPQQTQELMKLSDTQLKDYVSTGHITQDEFDSIKNLQKTADSTSIGNQYTVPDGAVSQLAKDHFSHWNSMDAKDQKAWLDQPADSTSQQITQEVNSQRSKGLSEFKPSNQLAQLYANYENDINTHKTGDGAYTDVDLRNKAKAFQEAATKLNYNANVNDIFSEGGSSDLKTLISENKIPKADLDAAMKMDGELYTSGLTSSLKFNKAFRTAHGYSVPTSQFASGSSKSSGQAPGTPTFFQGNTVPTFSATERTNPGAPRVTFKAPAGIIPAEAGRRVMIAPYRTKTITKLRNSVAK